MYYVYDVLNRLVEIILSLVFSFRGTGFDNKPSVEWDNTPFLKVITCTNIHNLANINELLKV